MTDLLFLGTHFFLEKIFMIHLIAVHYFSLFSQYLKNIIMALH